MRFGLVASILFVVLAGAQAVQTAGQTQLTNCPALSRAELPLYPPIARLANISGTVEIQVEIRNGLVVDAEVKSKEITSHNGPPLTDQGKEKLGLYLSNPSLANLKTWQFQSEYHAKFRVKYIYRIEGEPTSTAQTPRVDFDLPSVTITTRPIKPTCFDCGANIGGTVIH